MFMGMVGTRSGGGADWRQGPARGEIRSMADMLLAVATPQAVC